MHSRRQTHSVTSSRAVLATLVLLTLIYDFIVISSEISDYEAGVEAYEKRNQYRHDLRISKKLLVIDDAESLDVATGDDAAQSISGQGDSLQLHFKVRPEWLSGRATHS